MVTHSYLFFMEGEQIYRYQYRDGIGFEILQYSDDSQSMSYSSGFWQEWENDSCYQPCDFIDFAFLSDQKLWFIEIPKNYQVNKPTQFCTYQRIRDIFCKEILRRQITLSFNGNDEQIPGKRNVLDGELKKFYLIIPYPVSDNKLPQINNGDYTFGDYAKEKTQKMQNDIDKVHKRKLKS